jgi:hypothetical protein
MVVITLPQRGECVSGPPRLALVVLLLAGNPKHVVQGFHSLSFLMSAVAATLGLVGAIAVGSAAPAAAWYGYPHRHYHHPYGYHHRHYYAYHPYHHHRLRHLHHWY